MTVAKRKISVSLDEDLVQELEASGEPLSSQVNDAIRNDLGRRQRQRLLTTLVDDLEREHGAVSEKLVQHYVDLLA